MAPPSSHFTHGTEDVASSSSAGYGFELYDAGIAIQSVLFGECLPLLTGNTWLSDPPDPGFCLATTGLCLYYMVRRWRGSLADYIQMGFLLIMLAYNIVVFVMTIVSAVGFLHFLLGFFQT